MPRLVLAIGLLVLMGCTHNAYVPEDPPPSEPVARGTGTLRIQNASGLVIYRVRTALVQDGEWSDDRLDGAEVIKPGEERSFEVFSGRYNVQVEFKDGSIGTDDQVYVVRPNDEAVFAAKSPNAPELGTLIIVNQTGWAICRVFFSRTDAMGWGKDRLVGDQILAPRKRISWQVPPGRYNLKVEFQDGTSQEGDGAYAVRTGEVAIYELR